jgi:hypothetical protein
MDLGTVVKTQKAHSRGRNSFKNNWTGLHLLYAHQQNAIFLVPSFIKTSKGFRSCEDKVFLQKKPSPRAATPLKITGLGFPYNMHICTM